MKSQTSNKTQQFKVFLVAALAMALLICLGGFLIGCSAKNTLLDVLAQVFITFLPGFALILLLFDKKVSPFLFCLIAYGVGYAINIFEYLLAALFGLGSSTLFIALAVSLVSAALIVFCVPYKESLETGFKKEEAPFVVIFILVLVISYLAYSCSYVHPMLFGESERLTADLTYWMGNSAELTIEFPPDCIRLYGATYHYHYFSSMQIAFISLVSGIPVFELSVPLFSLTKALLLFGGLYALASLVDTKRMNKVAFLVILLFTCGFETYTTIIQSNGLYAQPFGADVGQAFQAYTIFFLVVQYQDAKHSWKTWTLFVLTWFCAIGAKAPYAAITLCAIGIICFYWLIKKRFACAFSYGLATLAIFGVVAVYFVGMFSSSGGEIGGWTFFGNVVACGAGSLELFDKLLSFGLPSILAKLIMLLVYEIALSPILFLLYITEIVVFFAVRKTRTGLNTALLLMSTAGLFLGVVNVQSGQSQGYFTGATVVSTMFLALILSSQIKFFSRRVVQVLLLLLIAFQAFLLGFCTYRRDGGTWDTAKCGIVYYCINGAQNIGERFSGYYQEDALNPEAIQDDDYLAMAWIRDNTPVDSLVLSDRSVYISYAYMAYGVFSQRNEYLEGYCYERVRAAVSAERKEMTEALYANSAEALIEARDAGIDYIIQTKWVTPNFVPDESLCSLVFESPSIRVFEVL